MKTKYIYNNVSLNSPSNEKCFKHGRTQNQYTSILFSVTFSENRAIYENNVEKCGTAEQATDENIIRRIRFACWITKATDKHTECVIILAFAP